MLKKLIIFSLVLGLLTQLNAFETQTNGIISLAVPHTAQNIVTQPFIATVDDSYVITINAHAINGSPRQTIVTIQILKNGLLINEYSSAAIPRGARATLTHTFNTELMQGDTITFKAKSSQTGVSLPIFNNEPAFKATIKTKETKTKLL